MHDLFIEQRVQVNFVLVTFDPAHDTPERLREYKKSHHLPESWHFLNGDDAQTQSLARFLGFHRTYGDVHIDHETKILVFDGQGGIMRTFRGWHFEEREAVRL